MVTLSDLKNVFRGHIGINEPLAEYTSMKVGGPVDYYLEPADKQDLVAIVNYFREQNFPFMVIGRGSNILVSDDGVRGAAINLEAGLSSVAHDGQTVVAESGARLTKLVDYCIQRGLAGLEWAAGIPGSVGGAVMMNAGAHGGQISDHLVDVEVLRQGSLQTIPKQEAEFAYRSSGFQKDVILAVRFLLPAGEKEELMKKKSELIKRRNETQPLSLPNSGSMFKNPAGSFAAKLIEQAGLKGKRVGNAQISEKHANFIVNHGGAKAADVVTLLELVRRTVYQNTGILLEPEVKFVGFPQNDVLKVA